MNCTERKQTLCYMSFVCGDTDGSDFEAHKSSPAARRWTYMCAGHRLIDILIGTKETEDDGEV